MLLLFIGVYSIPFILTNSDPRLRFPIDMLVLPYLAYLACLSLNGRQGKKGLGAA
jgi:hypothetical protein